MSPILHWTLVQAPSSWWHANGKAGDYSIQSNGVDKVLSLPNGTSVGFEDVELAKQRADEFELRFIATAKPSTPKFWMVYGINQGSPRYQHRTKEEAAKEARRLSQSSPGVTFVVLEAVDAFQAPTPEVQQLEIAPPEKGRFSDDDVPF